MGMRKRVKNRTGKSGVVWNRTGWYPVIHGFCPGKKEWRRYVKSVGIKSTPYPNTGRARTDVFTIDGQMELIVTLADTAMNMEVLASCMTHEASHVWDTILSYVGEKEKPGGEVTAYAIQAITKDLLEAYAVTRGRKKKKAKK